MSNVCPTVYVYMHFLNSVNVCSVKITTLTVQLMQSSLSQCQAKLEKGHDFPEFCSWDSPDVGEEERSSSNV